MNMTLLEDPMVQRAPLFGLPGVVGATSPPRRRVPPDNLTT